MAGSMKFLGNNKYKLIVSLGYNKRSDGQTQIRRCKTVVASSRKEAEKLLARFYLEQSNLSGINKDMTFDDFAKVFKQRHSDKLSLACRTNYEDMLNNRILDAFGKIKLSRVATDMSLINNFAEYLKGPAARIDNRKQYLSGETVRKHLKLIQLMLNKAVAWGFLTSSIKIPADVFPKANTKHYPILSTEDLTHLLHVVDSHEETANYVKNKLFFYICLTTGTRRGEAAGLTWDCLDLKNRVFYVNKSLKVVSGKPREMGKTKTEKSTRVLYFDEHLADLFRRHKYYQDDWLKNNGFKNTQNLVFVHSEASVTGETQYYNPNSCFDWLKKLCLRNNIPHIGLHSLRAQCATIAASIGTPINLVSAQLGHSNIGTTSIYVRDMLDMRKKVSDKMFSKLEEIRRRNT